MTRNASHTFIAIDPGLRTGVAVFSGDDVIMVTTTESPHEELRDIVRGQEVVCEQGPVNRLQAAMCEEVEAIVRQEAAHHYWIRPSDWKGHPSAVVQESDGCSTKHEREAVSLGRCWYRIHRRQHAGESQASPATAA